MPSKLYTEMMRRYPQMPLTDFGRTARLSDEMGLGKYNIHVRENPNLEADHYAAGGEPLPPRGVLRGEFSRGKPTREFGWTGPTVVYKTEGPYYRGFQFIPQKGPVTDDGINTQVHELIHAADHMMYSPIELDKAYREGRHFMNFGTSDQFSDQFGNFLESRRGKPLNMTAPEGPWYVTPEEWEKGLK